RRSRLVDAAHAAHPADALRGRRPLVRVGVARAPGGEARKGGPMMAPRVSIVLVLVAFLARAGRAVAADAAPLKMEQAVAIAFERNRDVIAARLEIRAAELDQVAAGLYPNPVLSYSIGNLPVGSGNPYNVTSGAPASPGFLSQLGHNVALAEIIEV